MLTETIPISVKKTAQSKIDSVDFNNLVFGRVFSDHMFNMVHDHGEWKKPEILPFGNLSLSPASPVLHYGQAIFEGLKAHLTKEGEVVLFRPQANAERFNKSAQRLCMPHVPVDFFVEALIKLIDLDRNWVPNIEGGSLYLRPFMYAIEEFIGVKPAGVYNFTIFTSPVASYYKRPVRVKIEQYYSRAIPGGMGEAKAAGNYAASLLPAMKAKEAGFDQLLWTDATTHEYIEESGTMNVMFVKDGKIITPGLDGSILPGITRESIITIAKDWGLDVEERKVAVAEIIDGVKSGTVTEAFGVGTAATLTQIESIGYQDQLFDLPKVETREISTKISKYLNDLKYGRVEDTRGWMVKI